jgi:tetratricopeptide (TPR) repeat protein
MRSSLGIEIRSIVVIAAIAAWPIQPGRAQQPVTSGSSLSAGINSLEQSLSRAQSDPDRLTISVSLARLYVTKAGVDSAPEYYARAETLLTNVVGQASGATELRALDELGRFLDARGRLDDAIATYARLEAVPGRNVVSRREYATFLFHAAVALEKGGRDSEALVHYRQAIHRSQSLVAACESASELIVGAKDRNAALALLDQLIDDRTLACADTMLGKVLRADQWRADANAYQQLLTVWVRFLAEARVDPADYAKAWRPSATDTCELCNQRLTAIDFAMNGEITNLILDKATAERFATGWLTNGYARSQYARLAAVAAKQYASTAGRETVLLRLLWAWNLDRSSLPTTIDLLETLDSLDSQPPWAINIIDSLKARNGDRLASPDEPLAVVRFHDVLGRLLATNGNIESAIGHWQSALAAYSGLESTVRAEYQIADLAARLAAAEAAQGCFSDAKQHYALAIGTYAHLTQLTEAASLLARLEELPPDSDGAASVAYLRELVDAEGLSVSASPERRVAYLRAWIAADPSFRKAELDVKALGQTLVVSGSIDTKARLAELKRSVASIPGAPRIVTAVAVSESAVVH